MDEFDVIAWRSTAQARGQFAACRCRKISDGACTRLATQEDFLCDICRPGCTVVTIMPFQGAPGSIKAHYEVRGWNDRG